MSHSILSRALVRYKAGVACRVFPFNLEMFLRPRVHYAGLMLLDVELWVRLFTKLHWYVPNRTLTRSQCCARN
jgi:hypothetical protein